MLSFSLSFLFLLNIRKKVLQFQKHNIVLNLDIVAFCIVQFFGCYLLDDLFFVNIQFSVSSSFLLWKRNIFFLNVFFLIRNLIQLLEKLILFQQIFNYPSAFSLIIFECCRLYNICIFMFSNQGVYLLIFRTLQFVIFQRNVFICRNCFMHVFQRPILLGYSSQLYFLKDFLFFSTANHYLDYIKSQLNLNIILLNNPQTISISALQQKRTMNRFLSAFHRDKRRPQTQMSKLIKKATFYGVFGLFIVHYLTKTYKVKLTYAFQKNEDNLKIIENNNVLQKGVYQPTFYMPNSYMQRIYAKYFQDAPYIKPQISPATKSTFEVNWIPIHDKFKSKKDISIAIIITGSEGIDNSVRSLVLSAYKNGFRSVCVKLDDVHDLERIKNTINFIKAKHFQSNQNSSIKTFGIGVEYGANLLVKYAAQDSKVFNGLVSIGNPLDLQLSQKKIQNSNWLWKKLLYTDVLKGRIQGYKKYISFTKDQKYQQNIENTSSLYTFDKQHHNSKMNDQQYKIIKDNLSCINWINKITVPLLMIQCQQDPFSIQIDQQVQQKIDNPKCVIIETPQGGHTEWFESSHAIRWVRRPVMEFLKFLDKKSDVIV